ncbi:MAG: hypothetical protein AAFP92_32970, partial [Bacteroidota bacterium]
MSSDAFTQTWWEKEAVPHFEKPADHPLYAGWSPTADVDVQWFRVDLSHTGQKFSFSYFEVGKIFVGYGVKEDGRFLLSVGAPGLDKSQLTEKELSYVNPHHRCSIWLASEEAQLTHQTKPHSRQRFSLPQNKRKRIFG